MKTDRSGWQLPRDWIVLLTVPTIAVLSAYVFPVMSNALHVSPAIVLVSLVLAGEGIILLFFARLLLYRQGKQLASGPNKLPQSQPNLYRIGYACIILSMVIMMTLLAIPRQKTNNQGEPTAAAAASRGP